MPDWSGNIGDAWRVVEKMHENLQWSLALEWHQHEQEWGADFDEWSMSHQAVGKNAPEAICRAALLAILESNESAQGNSPEAEQ
ncbi:hypothetical protein D3C76_1613610 [compost metagenome]